MKISVNWVRQFTEVNTSAEELVRIIGEQIGEVESVDFIGRKYAHAVVVKVVSCEKHPNADKLSVCIVDDGGITSDVERTEEDYVQVVCGAPNVHAGMMAVWLPPGATVPNSYDGGDPFVLDAREIRGQKSNGMLASSKELAIGDDHGGIVEVDVPVDPGTLFAEAYDLDDIIIDIENKMFTHRPDCFGVLGVAREIAGVQDVAFSSPDWYAREPHFSRIASELHLEIDNQVPERVPRFSAVVVDNISVQQSPLLLQTYLARLGIRPINSVVDATNYVMVLTGQPLHAYDAHKLAAVSGKGDLQLGVRMAKKGDIVELLDGKTITFDDDDETVLITTHGVPVGVGGVMGGAATEVDEDTTRVVLEAATFDMYGIRRTSMKHGLFTDAVTRFNKGQSPLQTTRALKESVLLLERDSNGAQASEVVDDFPAEESARKQPVVITPEFVSHRLGIDVSGDELRRLLENVEFSVHATTESYQVTPPFWRQDIEIAEDIVEEILRLKGYESLDVALPSRSVAPVEKNVDIEQAQQIRRVLSSIGANEALTYSFVHKKLFETVGQDASQAFALTNALSPDLHYYRLSLTPSLLERIHSNHKMGYKEFGLFELSKVHQKDCFDAEEPEVPLESPRLAFVYSCEDKQWERLYTGAAYFQAALYLKATLNELSVPYELVPVSRSSTELSAMQEQMVVPFEVERSAFVYVDDIPIGIVGELKQSIRRAMKLPIHCAAFELAVSLLKQEQKYTYRPLSKFPKIQQDISLKVSAGVPYKDLRSLVQKVLGRSSELHFELKPIDIFAPQDDNSSKHIAFRVIAWSEHKTMRTDELSNVLEAIAEAAAHELDAVRL